MRDKYNCVRGQFSLSFELNFCSAHLWHTCVPRQISFPFLVLAVCVEMESIKLEKGREGERERQF